MGERAAALGRLGRDVEAALAALAGTQGPDRTAEIMRAADAVWRYFVQREACGLVDHAWAIADYRIPREVLAKVGASVVR
jgi:hypothetical protein